MHIILWIYVLRKQAFPPPRVSGLGLEFAQMAEDGIGETDTTFCILIAPRVTGSTVE
jgi:hypothetical protein